MEEIRRKFALIDDWRHPGYVEHKLADVLIIVMCAVLCGLDSLSGVLLFAQKRAEFLRERFGIEKIPSKATLGRILCMVEGAAVGSAIVEIMRERVIDLGEVIAVDGKAICGTSKDGKPHSALQILTAYATASGVILGQKAIHEKTNEIPVFQEMLDYLDIKGKTITADAMHCQRETCRKIVEKNGDYLFGLKENQKSLFDDVSLFFADKINDECIETHRTSEKNAGRFEVRTCRKITDLSWLAGLGKWASLRSVFAIERVVDVRGRRSEETSYYISSLDASPEKLMETAREHWKIESLHWMLDVVFSEDDCRVQSENAHNTLNAFRKFALLIHKRFLTERKIKSTVKAHLLACLLDYQLFDELLLFL
jgi:predicted transposase YbfD/YdcC